VAAAAAAAAAAADKTAVAAGAVVAEKQAFQAEEVRVPGLDLLCQVPRRNKAYHIQITSFSEKKFVLSALKLREVLKLKKGVTRIREGSHKNLRRESQELEKGVTRI